MNMRGFRKLSGNETNDISNPNALESLAEERRDEITELMEEMWNGTNTTESVNETLSTSTDELMEEMWNGTNTTESVNETLSTSTDELMEEMWNGTNTTESVNETLSTSTEYSSGSMERHNGTTIVLNITHTNDTLSPSTNFVSYPPTVAPSTSTVKVGTSKFSLRIITARTEDFNVRGDFLTRTTQYLNSSYAKYAKENDWDFENLELSIVKEDRKRLRHRNLNEQDTTEVVSYNVKGVHMKGTLTFGVSDSLPTVADIDVLLADFFTGTGREQYIISLKSSTDEILASTFNSYFTFPEKRTEYKDMVTLVDSEDPELEIVEDENEVTKLSKALIITICASVGGVLFMLVLTFCVMEYYRRKQIVKDEYSDDQQTTLPERFEDLHEHQADSDNRTSHTFKKHYPIGLPISSSEEYTSSTRSPSCDGESYREKTTVLSGRGRWTADDQTQQTEDTQSKADSLAEIEKKLSKLLADSHEESTVGQSTYASSVVSYATSPTSTTKDVKSLVSGPKKKSSQRSLSRSQRSTSSSKVSRESRSVTRINDSIREIEDNIAEINAEINETMGKSTRSRSISTPKLKKKEPRAPRCGNSVSKSLPSTMKRATSRNNNLNEIVDSEGEKENIASSANKAEHRRKPRKGKCDNSVSRTLHPDDKEKMDRMKQSRRHRSRRSQPEFGKTCHKNCLSTTNSQLRSSLKPTASFGKSENNVRIHPNFAPDETKDGDGLSKKLTFNFSDVTESVAIDASDSFAVEMVPSTLGTTLGNDDVNEKDDSNTEVDKKNQSSNNETPGAKSRKSHRRQRTRTRLPPDSFSFSSSSTSSKTREKRLRVKERMQYSNPEISKTPGTIYGSLDGQ